MSLLVVGLSHRTAPVALLERAAVGRDDAAPSCCTTCCAASTSARRCVLSTCNRVEVYAEVDRFHGGLHDDLDRLLAAHSGVPWTSSPAAPVRALRGRGRRSTCSRSPAGWTRWWSARRRSSASSRAALQAGAGAGHGRTGRCTSWSSSAAGRQAGAHRDRHRPGRRLAGRRRPRRRPSGVLGAARRAARRWSSAPARWARWPRRRCAAPASASIVVANRTRERAQRLAAARRWPRPAVTLADLAAELAAADMVVSCTGAAGPVAAAEVVEPRCRRRRPPAGHPRPGAAPRRRPGRRRAARRDTRRPRRRWRAGRPIGAATPTCERGRARSSAEEVAAYLGAARPPRSPRPWSRCGPRGRGGRRRAGPAGAPAARTSTPATRAEVDRSRAAGRATSCCTRRPCGSRSWPSTPGGDQYAEALRELFGLDPAAEGRRRRQPSPPTEAMHRRRSRHDRALRLGHPAAARWPRSQIAAGRRRAAPRLGREVELVEIVTTGDRSTAALTQIGGTGVFVIGAARRAARRASRRRGALAARTCRPRPSRGIVDRRRAGARGPARRAGRPRRPDARRAAGRRRASAPARRGGPPSCARSGSASTSSPIRGNVDTRIAQGRPTASSTPSCWPAPGWPGSAGWTRSPRCSTRCRCCPRPAQGALAVECRAADDDAASHALARARRPDTRAAVAAERALLAALEAGCTAPVGALAVIAEGDDGPELFLRGR